MSDLDLLVIGGGAAGIGAAISAGRAGLKTLLVERGDCLGGTASRGGVSGWESGVGGTGIPLELYRAAKKRVPAAAGIYGIHRHCCAPDKEMAQFPGGEHTIMPERRYADTLLRHGAPAGDYRLKFEFARRHWFGVAFVPEAYAEIAEEMVREAGCEIRCGVAFESLQRDGDRITDVTLTDGSRHTPRFIVDATADALIPAAAGCPTRLGQESRDIFGEPSAPEQAQMQINGVTLMFRIGPTDAPGIEDPGEGLPNHCWWAKRFPSVHAVELPDGTISINMLPSMVGSEFLELGYQGALEECNRRLRAQWHHLQTEWPDFQSYKLHSISPDLGVRESRRVVARYTLTEADLMAGLAKQTHDDIITIADHMADVHGHRCAHYELKQPYGVPFRCMVPLELENVLVAGRAGGFSAIAASSCRLTRTMMQLGQAAGTAAALAKSMNVGFSELPPIPLRDELRSQGVQLAWPMEEDVARRVEEVG